MPRGRRPRMHGHAAGATHPSTVARVRHGTWSGCGQAASGFRAGGCLKRCRSCGPHPADAQASQQVVDYRLSLPRANEGYCLRRCSRVPTVKAWSSCGMLALQSAAPGRQKRASASSKFNIFCVHISVHNWLSMSASPLRLCWNGRLEQLVTICQLILEHRRFEKVLLLSSPV